MGAWDDRAVYNKGRPIGEQIYGEIFRYAKTQPCCAQRTHECIMPITGAHLLTAGNGNPDHDNVVAACILLHRMMHDMGHKKVERRLGINLTEEAKVLTHRLVALG